MQVASEIEVARSGRSIRACERAAFRAENRKSRLRHSRFVIVMQASHAASSSMRTRERLASCTCSRRAFSLQPSHAPQSGESPAARCRWRRERNSLRPNPRIPCTEVSKRFVVNRAALRIGHERLVLWAQGGLGVLNSRAEIRDNDFDGFRLQIGRLDLPLAPLHGQIRWW
jgi:hypothetical protein